ncbi:MAG TPA: hypothetical protein VMV83_08540 [Rectinemataceae bacterium]|nr:hypothetical protein [Rectinemataceae bacterium]
MAARPDTTHDGKSTRPQARRDDLERYGVWVKAEPQDISPEPESGASPEGSPSPESFLTDEEERLLGSFSDIDTSEAANLEIPEGDQSDDIFESLPEIEDFEISDSQDAKKGAKPSEVSDDDLEFELSMEDLSAGFQEEPISPHTPIDLSTVEGLDGSDQAEEFSSLPDIDIPEEVEDFETVPEGALRKQTKASGSSPELEDVSSEFLEGFSSSEAADASDASTVHDVTDEFLDLESPSAPSRPVEQTAEPDFEALDIELHFEDEQTGSAPVDHAAAGFEDIGESDGFLDTKERVEDFDDIAALERDLGEESPAAAPSTRAASRQTVAASEPGLANELLLKIANELSSIRGELVTLKSQLSATRLVEQPAAPAQGADLPEEPEATGGFFDEEDDEKIALTGDELDNILNSADFTEEASTEGLPEEGASAGDFGAMTNPEELILDEGILPETGDYAQTEEVVERISLEGETAEQAMGEEGKADDEIIARLADEGILPLTPAPEDTSYLEEPLEEEALGDMPEAPIVEAPLVEPDLSELALDLGVGEEDFEISGDLPVMETEELSDIALGLDAVALPETEEAVLPLEEEPLPEFEEDLSFGDIELATEDKFDATAPVEEELVEELADFENDSFPIEEVLHHEDKDLEPEPEAYELPSEEAIDEIELDSELFVPSPSEKRPEDISLSSRPEDDGVEELILEEEVEPFGEEAPLEATAAAKPVQVPPAAVRPSAAAAAAALGDPTEKLKSDIRSVLSYLDRLLESLPEEKIEEFAHSEHFDTYKKLFEELGLV